MTSRATGISIMRKHHAEGDKRFFGQSSQHGNHGQDPQFALRQTPEQRQQKEAFAGIHQPDQAKIRDSEVDQVEQSSY